MNKTISNLIAFITILVSTLCYLQIYIVMVDSSPSSKGLAEYFTFISSILFIINGLSLASIINEIAGFKKYIILSLYLLIGIIPMAIQNQFSIIPTTVFSIIVMTISISLISKLRLSI
ncbi:hypothetical protein CLU83_3637 [Flavobacterium sp. 1]|uniref:hypothetical protein n=1 Tax=Flavobacterium sp. 1 TaxID=2035200 RepID=UPI000C2463A9|nr:hypothetical protein [Flavobacterium sp. 1]PJJ10238.1 hypothetical protein CLU83_3637 [Flavobacterium sp. 1]